jgi:hypothetical protein
MRKLTVLATGLALIAGLSACTTSRSRPDEFAVARQRPLVVPPDYALVPPAPGTAIVQGQNLQSQTLEAMFGGPQLVSRGEAATVGQAGAADAAIRSNVADPGTTVVDKGATTRDIVAAPEGDGQDARAATKPKQ